MDPQPAPAPAPKIEQPAAPPASRQSPSDRAFVGTLTAIAAILASRLLLLLAVIGTFVLALLASDMVGVIKAGGFAGLVVLPLIVLDIQSRRR